MAAAARNSLHGGRMVQAALEIGDAMRVFSNREMYNGRDPSFTHCYGPHPAIVRCVL